MTNDFWQQIDRFNAMYKLPCPMKPVLQPEDRLISFVDMLREELTEVEDVINEPDRWQKLIALSDLLGDLIIYCATEARRNGLPMAKILNAIMESNFSKLGEDGKPIYDERGKVMKGPNYKRPEPMIEQILTRELCK